MNINTLKNKINEYAEKLIDEYFRNKTNIFIQECSKKYNINYSDLVDLYKSTYDEPITYKNQCQATTKNGINCSHKCLPGRMYCKKHMSKETTVEYQTSYFPKDNSDTIV